MVLDLAHLLLHMRINLMPTPVPRTKRFLRILKDLYTEEEAWLLVFMPPFPATAKTIARLQLKRRARVEAMLRDLVKRGLMIDIAQKKDPLYMVPAGIPGLIEFQLMRGEDTPQSRRFAQSLRETIHGDPDEFYGRYEKIGSSFARVVPVNTHVQPDMVQLPYEDARNIIMKAQRFALTNCYCRHEKRLLGEKTCDSPDECCMALNFGADFIIRNNFGREVDRETMLRKLEETEKFHLVHMTDNTKDGISSFLCNCCGCCCGLLGALTKFQEKPPFVMSSMVICLDRKKCNNCGKCVQACNVKALSSINKITVLNQKKCIGCGHCVDICPQDAISVIPRPGWQEPPADYGEMMVDLMERRFRLGPLTPFMIPFVRKFAVKKVNQIYAKGNAFGK